MEETTYGWPDAEPNQGVMDRCDQQRDTFSRVREYVAAHLDSRLDVDGLARIVGMSVSRFSRSFHKAVGLPPHTYVIQCRVMRAQELLATTQLPQANAGATFHVSSNSGRFHGAMIPTTPSGLRSV